MKMSYLKNPETVSFNTLKEKKILSISPYKNLDINNPNTKPLTWFYDKNPVEGGEIGSDAYVDESPHLFMRTEAVKPDSFTLKDQPHQKSPPFQPCKKQDFEKAYGGEEKNLVRKGDIFYPTGGYLGKIGICGEDRNAIYSSHFYKLRIKEKYRGYVFGMLKSSFGKQQTELWPGGAIDVLDTFKDEYLESLQIPLPNQSNSDEVIDYVNSLVNAVIRREKKIQEKYRNAISTMEKEIEGESTGKEKVFSMPTFDDLKEEKRLDTRIYSGKLQRYEDLIKSYENGYYEPGEAWDVNRKKHLNGKYQIIRGQNLQKSNIGRSVYRDRPKDGYYRLILSSNMSRFMTVPQMEYLGNPKELQTVKKGDVIFSLRGHLGSTIVYCEDDENTITNIDNAHIRREDSDLADSITLGFYLRYLVESEVVSDIAATGSGADSLALYHFGNIYLPKFPEDFQSEMKKIYHNENTLEDLPSSPESFENIDQDIVAELGIHQLREQIRDIRSLMDGIVSEIVDGNKVEVDYSFLN